MCVVQAVNDLPGQAWVRAHGLGWQVWNVEGRRYVGHGGSMPGFLAGLQVDVETGDGVVDLQQHHQRAVPLAAVTCSPWSASASRSAGPPGTPVAPTPTRSSWSGLWHWGPAVTMIKASGEGGLELGPPGEGAGPGSAEGGRRVLGRARGLLRGGAAVVVRDATAP